MYPRGQLSRVQSLGIMTRLRCDVGQHGGLASERPQAFLEHLSDSRFLEWQMTLAIKYAQDDIAKAAQSDVAT